MAKSSVIGSLRVNLGMDTAEFRKGVKQADKAMAEMASKIKTGLAVAGAAVTAAVAGIGAAVGKTINHADRLGEVSDMLGVNVEALQEFRHAAEMSGMQVQNFDVALRRFIRRGAEAARGTGAAKNAFRDLGISLTDGQGRMKKSEDLLHEVADAMSKVKDPADKLRLAFQMFDTDGAAMVTVLAGGSEGLRKFAQEARDLGIVLSEETVKGAGRFKDNLDLLRKVAEGFFARLTAHMLPALERVTSIFLEAARNSDWMKRAAEVLTNVFDGLTRAAILVYDNFGVLVRVGAAFISLKIASAAVGMAVAIVKLAAAIRSAGLIAVAFNTVLRAKRTIMLGIAGAIAYATGQFDDFQGVLKRIGDAIGAAIPDDLADKAKSILGPEGLGLDLSALEVDLASLSTQNAETAQTLADLNNALGGTPIVTEQSRKAMADLKREGERLTETMRTPLEQYQAQVARLNELMQAGAINSTTYARAIAETQNAFAEASMRASEFSQTIKSNLESAFDSLVEGTFNARAALAGLMKDLAKMAMNSVFQSLFAPAQVGGGGLGGIFAGIGKLFGFAKGGEFKVGGAGGIDSQLVAFRASPNETVRVTRPDQERHGGAPAEVRVHVEPSPYFDTRVEQVSGRVAIALDRQNNKATSGRVAQDQKRFG